MKTTALGLLVLVFSLGTTAFVLEARNARRFAEVGESLDSLRRGQLQLRNRLDARPPAPPAVKSADLDRAVARWMETHGLPKTPAAAPPVGAAAAEPPEAAREGAEGTATAAPTKLDLDEALVRLSDPRTPYRESEKLWGRIASAGRLDEAISVLKGRVEEAPRDADRQAQLGTAYIQKLVHGASDKEKATLARSADQAFDAALLADPHHWQARFQKGVSLSFWPPIFGKQAEAVKQLELLRDEQESSAQRPEFAQTYLFLGNLHLQSGSRDKAVEVWRRGLELFPQSEELRQRSAEVESK
jgi:tetratricopeptide (TPR) repeat protein